MTDNEIIKALECCKERDIDCVSNPQCGVCPQLSYFHTVADREDCRTLLFAKALDLINRQKAEIERYLHSIKLLEKDVQTANAEIERLKARNDELNALNKTASIEAIKEFAELYERVIEQLLTSATIEQAYVIYKCLDKFKALSHLKCTEVCLEIPKETKEMVGDDNAL